jgi:hypothetical protein
MLAKIASEAEQLRDKLAETLAKIGPAEQKLQSACELVEEADKFHEQCIASLREPKAAPLANSTPRGRVQAAQLKLDAANEAAEEAKQQLKDEQDEATKQEADARRAAAEAKTAAEAEAARPQPTAAPAAPSGAAGVLVQLQIQDAKATVDALVAAAAEGEGTSDDQDMPQQQLALQSSVAKRAAEVAAAGIVDAEAALKKLRSATPVRGVRGKTAPRS